MEYGKEKKRKWAGRTGVVFAGLFCMVMLFLLSAKEALAQTEGTVQASSANIRQSADAGSTALASVVKGDKLTITEEVAGVDGKVWYKVFIDANSQGYIRSDLVSKDDGSAPSVTATTPPPAANTNNNEPSLNTNVTVNTEGVQPVSPISASVTNDKVRVRADSSTNSDIVTTVKKDVVLTVNGTKTGSSNDTWYLVGFVVDGTEVTGFIRSDYVTLSGDLVPVTEEPEAPVDTPADNTPTEPVAVPKDYETAEEEGVWYLIDNVTNNKYQVAKLLTIADQNATDLEKAQKKVSRQTGIIVVLAIFLVVMALGITLLFFKLKDLMEEDGFDFRLGHSRRRSSGSGQRTSAASARRPMPRPSAQAGQRPAGARPVQAGQRPVGQKPVGVSGERPQTGRPTGAGTPGERPAGARPVQAGQKPAGASGERPQTGRPTGAGTPGERPAGARPVQAGQRPVGQKPVGASGERPQTGRPTGAGTPGERPAGARPVQAGQRPVGQKPVGASGERPQTGRPTGAGTPGERPAGARPVQAGQRPVGASGERAQTKRPEAHVKNFMADNDEFEFEFLNWDGEDEK